MSDRMTMRDAFCEILKLHLERARAGDNLSRETVLLMDLIKSGWGQEDELAEPPELKAH